MGIGGVLDRWAGRFFVVSEVGHVSSLKSPSLATTMLVHSTTASPRRRSRYGVKLS